MENPTSKTTTITSGSEQSKASVETPVSHSTPTAIQLTEKELAEIEAGYQAWLEGKDYTTFTSSSPYEGSNGYDN